MWRAVQLPIASGRIRLGATICPFPKLPFQAVVTLDACSKHPRDAEQSELWSERSSAHADRRRVRRAYLLIVKWAFSHDRNRGIILPIDHVSRLIAERRTGKGPMNRNIKTKAQQAEENANLDEALDESFPASDPPSMTQPRTGADLRLRKPKRHPEGEAIQPGTRRSRASPTEQSPSRVGKSGQ
jgi:hypothetical protein